MKEGTARVDFPPACADEAVGYVVIVSRHHGKWVFVRHRERTTLECPGGHREAGETVEAAARRELYEETGATAFGLSPVGFYRVMNERGAASAGMLYFAEIEALGALPPSEIAEVQCLDAPPQDNWTYPHIQPLLLARVREGTCA